MTPIILALLGIAAVLAVVTMCCLIVGGRADDGNSI